MMEEEEKEIDKNLFAPIYRVSSQDDFLHLKITSVMGDYVESQSFISDLIYVSHQDREFLLPLFPPRRLDLSYHGIGPRPRAYQPNVKVSPLQPSKSTTKTSPGPPQSKLAGANVNVHEKKQNREDCSSTGWQPKALPSSVPVAIQRSSGGSDIFSKPESQPADKEANVKSDENIKSKQIEDSSFLLNVIDRHKIIDIDAMIKEMRLPPLISPISSPEARMSVETVLKEMIINISPLSPIPNTERQDKKNQNITSSAKACDGNSNIGLHSVQDILGDISSSSDEENDADKSTEPLAIGIISPKAVNFNPPENISSIENIKSEQCHAPKSEGISCLEQEVTKSKEYKYNPTTGVCKDDIKITRPILAKNLSGSFKRGRKPANRPCSKILIAKTIQENSENESKVTYYRKDFSNSVKRPVSSFDPFKFQRSQNKMKIAPPSASQIVSRPNNVIPISMQSQDKQRASSNLLQAKYNKTPHNNQPKIRGSPNTRSLINLPRSKPPPPHYQQPVSRNENGISLPLSNLSKDIYVPNTSDSQPSIPILNPEQKSSSSARSPKDVPNKTDSLPTEKRPAMSALAVERPLPMDKLSNDRDISNVFDSLPTESQPHVIPSPEQSLSLNFLSANRTVAFLKGSPYSSVKRYKSSTEHDSEWTPQEKSDKKMFLKKLIVSPYKLSPSKSPKAESSFPKFKGKRLQVKINLGLMNEYFRNRLCSQIAKQTAPLSTPFSSPLFFPNFGNQRRKNKTTSKCKKLLIKLDTKLLSSIPTQNTPRHSFFGQGDAKPLSKRLCTSSFLNDSQQSLQEKIAIESDIKKLLKENSKSCYSRAKYLKDQAKIMKKEVQMFLHLLAANWFVLCTYQMEKEGCSPNSARRHLDEMGSFLNEIGCFEDVRMESLRYLLRAVVCQKRYELSSDRLCQLQADLNAEYKSIFGLSLFAPESTFRNCLDQRQKKDGNGTLAKSVSVSYRFLKLNKEYQSLVELLAKSQEFMSKAKRLMQGKYQFFSLVKSRLRNLDICLEIPLIVDFVKTCTELLQPKELGFIIAAQSR